jgi:hypothetical protein
MNLDPFKRQLAKLRPPPDNSIHQGFSSGVLRTWTALCQGLEGADPASVFSGEHLTPPPESVTAHEWARILWYWIHCQAVLDWKNSSKYGDAHHWLVEYQIGLGLERPLRVRPLYFRRLPSP